MQVSPATRWKKKLELIVFAALPLPQVADPDDTEEDKDAQHAQNLQNHLFDTFAAETMPCRHHQRRSGVLCSRRSISQL